MFKNISFGIFSCEKIIEFEFGVLPKVLFAQLLNELALSAELRAPNGKNESASFGGSQKLPVMRGSQK